MKVSEGWAATYEFACHSAACAPPPTGTGGSVSTGKIRHRTVTVRGAPRYIVEMMDGRKKMGKLSWSADENDISVHTYPSYRRQGVATRLWDVAVATAKERGLPAPKHSTFQTPDGKAWAEAVERRKATP